MIITKEQQIKILVDYIDEGHSIDKIDGFTDGINATIKLINKLTIKEDAK